jgi:hypothetical protein
LPPHNVWSSSASATVHHILVPLVSSGAVAGAPVWALAAALLPYLVNRRSLVLDAVRVAGWTAFVVSATELAVRAAGHGSTISAPRTAAVGAVVAAVVALCPSVAAAWRRRLGSNEPQAGIP